MDDHDGEKRREQNLFVHSIKCEVDVTNKLRRLVYLLFVVVGVDVSLTNVGPSQVCKLFVT